MTDDFAALGGRQSRRTFLGQSAALGLAGSFAGGFALPGASFAATPKKGGTLRLALEGGESTNTLDPALAASDVPFTINRTWGETLLDVDAQNGLDYRLAEEVSSNADATVWTLKIRKGVTFHDGAPLTPEDVVATLKRHTDEKSQSGAFGLVQGISDMKAGSDSVTLTLDAPNADLPFLLTDYHLMIQPGGGRDNPAAGVGCGPYRIASHEPGVRATFERFPDYFDQTIGHADKIEIVTMNDPTARVAALQSGQVDMVNRISPKVANLMKAAPGLQVVNTRGRGQYCFVMRCDSKPFDNNDLRLALKYAVNRQEMVDTILMGYGSLGNDFPINANYPLFDDTIEQRTYDPAKAREHYAKSGHDGSPIILQVATGAFPGAVDAAQLFAQSAAACGIPLEVKREPDDGYWSAVWNVAPFCASYWGGRPVQDQMYTTAYYSKAEWNDTRFVNADFDKMLIAARAELDPAKRKAIYAEMGRLVRDEGGLILPMFNDFIDALGPSVQGWVPIPNSGLMDGPAQVKCWLA